MSVTANPIEIAEFAGPLPFLTVDGQSLLDQLTVEDQIEIVQHAWRINPAAKTADMHEMESNRWMIVCHHGVNAPTVKSIRVPVRSGSLQLAPCWNALETWDAVKGNFKIVPIELVRRAEAEPKDIIEHFLSFHVPWSLDGKSVLRTFVGVKNSFVFSRPGNHYVDTIPRHSRAATISNAAFDHMLEIDPQHEHRRAALIQTLVYGAKVEDAAKNHGQSVQALMKHRQRILQEVRLRFPDEVFEPEPDRVRFQDCQFDPGIRPGTDPKRWEDADKK
jgi:hypothetical protein